jgi:hypothetical protein
VSFQTYWLVVPLVGAVLAWIGCLALWLTRPRGKDHKAAAAE